MITVESTPSAASRILKQMRQTPKRQPCDDLTNRESTTPVPSPLAQGKKTKLTQGNPTTLRHGKGLNYYGYCISAYCNMILISLFYVRLFTLII